MKHGEFIDLHWEEDVEAFHVRGHVSSEEFWAAVEASMDYTRAQILAEQELVRFEPRRPVDGTVVMDIERGSNPLPTESVLMPGEIRRGYAIYRTKDWTPVLHAWGRWSMERKEFWQSGLVLREYSTPGPGRFPITFIAWDRDVRSPGSSPTWWATAQLAP
jgi:hypothetical protein